MGAFGVGAGSGRERPVHCKAGGAAAVECAGGDLVVHEDGIKNQFRYTLGENTGTAAFKPHYVLYTAGAFRTVEEVTSGFSLILVYSLCLPPELPFIRGSNGSDLLRIQLAESIAKLNETVKIMAAKEENEILGTAIDQSGDDTNLRIALVLSKKFQLQDLTTNAWRDRPDVDRDRFEYLSAANAMLPPDEQIRLYLARLQYEIPDNYGRWDQKEAVESATWYTLRGEQLGGSTRIPIIWTSEFNFLNPGNETLEQLWKNGEGEFVYRYERFAIVGWPKVVDIKNTHVFMGEVAAASSVSMDAPVDFDRLRSTSNASPIRSRCLADALTDILSVSTALTIIAVQKAGFAFATSPEELVVSSDVGLLWKHPMACSNPQLFRDVGSLFARLDGKIIGPVVKALSACVTSTSKMEHCELLTIMATQRWQWLMHHIAGAEKPFAWEIVDMNFVGAAGFLQGTSISYQVRCFKGVDEAHRRMALLKEKIKAPLKMAVGGRGRDAYVLVTKQAGKFARRSQDIHRFKAEIHRLNSLLSARSSESGPALNPAGTDVSCGNSNYDRRGLNNDRTASAITAKNSVSTVGTKRPRDEPEIIVID
ncbi:unnamed protein product [Phytophthora fragariaefolia]|uniref:Unnamed protein product n=1 Tax=Phytophthora fragariaefolia TaxID=1490495 RepID=A0A9W7CPV6_9STRA|nr:unnamed protein product [Phytophthora fragariaefolia]